MATRTVHTTISLPVDLMEAADKAVRSGIARSRNDLLIAALRRELAAQDRAAIDDSFSRMAHDEEYLAEARAISDEFAEADCDAECVAEE
jgi:Arc/MetJ-type ribon-helix-helix transcriptional regulator